jgi:glutamate N-acetyltransferase/amino-acid N-acetyltransferase
MTKKPRGFLFSSTDAAIKDPGRDDMTLIYSEVEASVAAMFTKNRIKAAPVRLDRKRARSGKGRAILINSGNANACTGQRGMEDAREIAALAASRLGVDEKTVYVCSTGVIGVPLPMKKLRNGVGALASGLGSAGLADAASAIMTTDIFPKYITRNIRIGKKKGAISAICKGAGMIQPDMATMLCFVMTDIAVQRSALKKALSAAVEESFNMITVDGECSTNDTVIAMANGMLENPPITADTPNYRKFLSALSGICREMSRLIIKDGEGATKTIEVEVKGARSDRDARKCASAIANSLLVKTAIYGKDPNVGRIMAALGYSGAHVNEEMTDVSIGRVSVIRKGLPVGDARKAASEMKGDEVKISVNLNSGKGRAVMLTCDLTEEYVRINAEYTT